MEPFGAMVESSWTELEERQVPHLQHFRLHIYTNGRAGQHIRAAPFWRLVNAKAEGHITNSTQPFYKEQTLFSLLVSFMPEAASFPSFAGDNHGRERINIFQQDIKGLRDLHGLGSWRNRLRLFMLISHCVKVVTRMPQSIPSSEEARNAEIT